MKISSESSGVPNELTRVVLLACLLCFAAMPAMAQWTMQRDSFRYAIVVKEETYLDPEWAEVVDTLSSKYSGMVFTYVSDIDETQSDVGAYAPDYLAIVAKWNDANAAFVTSVWQYHRALDSDPYGDAIWGIITGFHVEDAMRIVTGPAGFDVITVLGGTTSCDLIHYPQGIATSEGTYGLYYTKALNDPNVVEHTDGPTDRTEWLVTCLNADTVDIFVTSGHGASYQWQLHYPTAGDEGFFRSYGSIGCQAVGVPKTGDFIPINSVNAKIFFGLGNCDIGKITTYNSMALGWLHTAGAYFYTGYVIPEGSVSQQHGGTKAYFERQTHYTWPEAYFLANQALYYDKYNGTPGAAGAPDLNGSALYGDPAMEARVADVGVYAPLLYTEEVIVDSSGGLWEVTVRITMNIEGTPGYTSKWGNRSPIVLLPVRVQDISVVSHDCKDVVVTDNFAILHIWNQSEDPLAENETREVVFTCNELTGISEPGTTPNPQVYNLGNHPNPFAGETIISFDLPGMMQVRLEVFDIAGRLVETLAEDVMAAGNHCVTWSGSSSGIYFCRLTTGSDAHCIRMACLR